MSGILTRPSGLIKPSVGSLISFATYAASLAPLSWWRLGEASGTSAADAGSLGVAGTYTGTPGSTYTLGQTGLVSGDSDKAVLFTTGFVDIADNAAWDFANYTFSVFALLNTSFGAGAGMIVARDGNTNARSWQFRINANKLELLILSSTGASIRTAASTASINGSTTHALGGSCDGSTVKTYVDGTPDGSATGAAFGTQSLANGVRINQSPRGATTTGGTFDEVLIFNRVLTDAEFAGLSTRALNGPA